MRQVFEEQAMEEVLKQVIERLRRQMWSGCRCLRSRPQRRARGRCLRSWQWWWRWWWWGVAA
eukprot:8244338-Lingulodinium_polyedra.AAC.1